MAILLMLALFLVFLIAQKHIYRKYWGRGLDFKLLTSSQYLFEGDKLIITEELSNKKLLPLPWIELSFEISNNFLLDGTKLRSANDNQYRSDIFSLLFRRKASVKMSYKCLRRGYYQLRDVVIRGSNLMMSEDLTKYVDTKRTVTVYPKLIDPEDFNIPFKRISGDVLTKRFVNPDPFEFKGIREYQPYDSFKSINFKASAKTGELMSNVFDCTVSQEIVIVLNMHTDLQYNRFAVCENAIRLAASLARYYIGIGVPTGFITNGEDIITRSAVRLESGLDQTHLYAIYEALARIDTAKVETPITELIPEPMQSDEQVYLFISGYQGEELTAYIEELKHKGSKPIWIIPHTHNEPPKITDGEDVIHWEVGKVYE